MTKSLYDDTNYGILITDSCLDAASRILRSEFVAIVNAADEMYVREDTAPLHDLRIGVRKFRAALRFFSPCLKDFSSTEVDQQLALMADVFSSTRDRDAWLEYLEQVSIGDKPSANQEFVNYIETLKQQRLEALPSLRHQLDRYFSYDFRDKVINLIYDQLDLLREQDNSILYKQFCAKRLGKYYRKFISQDCIKSSDAPEVIHAFRKRCRRGRYWSEFSIPLYTDFAKPLARYYRRMATALGTARDMQLYTEDMKADGVDVPKSFTKWQRKTEKQAWKGVKKTWEKLTSSKTRKRYKQVLHKGK